MPQLSISLSKTTDLYPNAQELLRVLPYRSSGTASHPRSGESHPVYQSWGTRSPYQIHLVSLIQAHCPGTSPSPRNKSHLSISYHSLNERNSSTRNYTE